MCHRAIACHAPALYILAVYARRGLPGQISQVGAVPAIEIHVLEVERMDVAWKITVRAHSVLSKNAKSLWKYRPNEGIQGNSPENCETDVDQQISAAAGYYEDACWRD